jgi:hypothetical protein
MQQINEQQMVSRQSNIMAHPKQVNILNYVNKVFIPNLKSEIKPLKIQGTPVENCACRQSESLK